MNFQLCGYTSSKAAAFVNHKGPFKAQCSHMGKHMFYFASAKEASLPPPKSLGNIPAMCVHPLWILSHCYCFCYTFSITSCCFPPTQLRKKKERKKAFLSHKKANLLYVKTTLSKTGSQELI